jgi:hypothetical protein
MSEKISIKSSQIDIISSKDDIKVNSNTFIHLSSNQSIKMETKIGDKQSKVWLSTPIIQLGTESLTNKYQPIVKGDDLEKELIEIYNLLLQIVSFPGAQIALGVVPTLPNPSLIQLIQGKLNSFKKKRKKWKSTVSKTV